MRVLPTVPPHRLQVSVKHGPYPSSQRCNTELCQLLVTRLELFNSRRSRVNESHFNECRILSAPTYWSMNFARCLRHANTPDSCITSASMLVCPSKRMFCRTSSRAALCTPLRLLSSTHHSRLNRNATHRSISAWLKCAMSADKLPASTCSS